VKIEQCENLKMKQFEKCIISSIQHFSLKTKPLKTQNLKMPAYHFIAIGGSAMHGLALALHEKGDIVTGSDDVIFEPSKSNLDAKGLLPEQFGWFPEKIHGKLDAVILGMHAKKDNPELLKAIDSGIPIFSYPEFLYEQSKNKTRVVIGGSHGKTTITSMILHVLDYHGKEVDYMAGALQDRNAALVHLTNENDFAVFEGDEYLSSALDNRSKFLHYKPNIALISGIAWDHINVFKTFEAYVDTFRQFIKQIVPGGILVYNEEDPIIKELVENSEVFIRKHPYHIPQSHIEKGKTILETSFGNVSLQVFGKHNLSNLAGAQWVCLHLGIDEEMFYEAITTFTGAGKRLEKILETNPLTIFKDFAHAPSKVKATVDSVKAQFKNKKVTACFELHTYSSLNPVFLKQYQNSMDAADTAVVFYDLEALKIKKMTPISPNEIRNAFGRKDLTVFTEATSFLTYLDSQTPKDDVWLLMSSGNYGGVNFEALKQKFN